MEWSCSRKREWCKESYIIPEENAETFHGRNGRVEGTHEADTKGLYLVAHLGMGGEITTPRAVEQPQ